MKLLLILPIIASTVFIYSAKAEGYYLILEKKGTGLERIKMTNKEECEQLGEQWGEVSSRHKFVCLKDN